MITVSDLHHFFFANELITWYQQVKRDLPWRKTKDPYAIWLSEVILQQTRVAQGLPYYQNFLEAFPTVQDLAEASQEEVLRLWQGLGYYSRARNLHKTAQAIAQDYHGQFPTSYRELIQLPGIGPYTAAAIASFAFREAVPVVDGNVFRVLARIFGEFTDIQSSKARTIFTDLAQQVIPLDRPDEFNQAIMEFGALYCTPQTPACLTCLAKDICYAHEHLAQGVLPVKKKKSPVKNRYLQYWVWEWEDRYAMQPRTQKDIWQGLWEFPCQEQTETRTEPQLPSGFTPPQHVQLLHEQIHLLSHQKLHLQFWEARSTDCPSPDAQWFTASEIEALPKPIALAQVWDRKKKSI